jgi:hypothetical protein
MVREPKDRDYFVSSTLHSGTWKPVDVSGDLFSHPDLDDWIGSGGRWATPDELYTVKVSHAHWDLRNGTWGKHMADILFLQEMNCNLIPDLYSTLYKVWEGKHGKKKMTFSESDEFFADAVVRKYDHDSLHESVAYGDHALYSDYLLPGRTVALDMASVWASEYDTIVQLFREEIYATALERWMVPYEYRTSPGSAYHWSLRRTITSLTKGKSSLWLIENFKDFRSVRDPYSPEENYVQRHLRKADKLIAL